MVGIVAVDARLTVGRLPELAQWMIDPSLAPSESATALHRDSEVMSRVAAKHSMFSAHWAQLHVVMVVMDHCVGEIEGQLPSTYPALQPPRW